MSRNLPSLHNVLIMLTESLTLAPIRYMQAQLYADQVPVLYIHIRPRAWKELTRQRDDAIAKGLLMQSDQGLVPATLFLNNNTHPVHAKLRLKGDWTDHLQGDKWSFRIQSKEPIMGMRRFNIEAPATRGNQADMLFRHLLEREGILTPRKHYIRVVRNGKDIGIMLMEEHMETEMLEAEGRSASVILDYDESPYWDGIAAGFTQGGIYYNYKTDPIDSFGTAKSLKDPVLRDNLTIATGLLRAFTERRLPASRVFDATLFGRYIGLCSVWDLWHGLGEGNIRFYYNPLTGKLEPIAYDYNVQDISNTPQLFPTRYPFIEHVMEDPAVRDAYLDTIHRYSDEILHGNYLTQRHEQEKALLLELHLDNPLINPLTNVHILTWAKLLANITPYNYESYKRYSFPITPNPHYPILAHAFVSADKGGLYLELFNAIDHPVRATRIAWRTSGSDPYISFQPGDLHATFPIDLPKTNFGDSPQIIRIRLPIKNTLPENVHVRVETDRLDDAGQQSLQTQEVDSKPYFPAYTDTVLPQNTLEQALRKYPFLILNHQSGHLEIKPGLWRINADIVLPDKMALDMHAGTTMLFAPRTGLYVYGPMTVEGTESAPVVFDAQVPMPRIPDQDFTLEKDLIIPTHEITDKGWSGITVMNANRNFPVGQNVSHWRYVTLRNTTLHKLPHWSDTGSIMFYMSDADIDHLTIENSHTEDGVNIKNSHFKMAHYHISHTISDGIDTDASTGTVSDSLFEYIGGDGLDIGGSDIKAYNSRFRHIHDKCYTIGEVSRAYGSGLDMQDCGTGVASKDLSQATIENSTIHVRHLGLAAYIKKAQYGPATLTANHVTIVDTPVDTMVQTGSRMTIDGKPVPTRDFDADKLYTQGFMKKK